MIADEAEAWKGYILGSNPYQHLQKYIESRVFPKTLPWGFTLLIFFGIWRILIVFLCLGIIMAAYLTKKEPENEKGGNLWLYRKVYKYGENGSPYVVPNHLLVLTGSEMFTSTSFIIFSFTMYQSNRSIAFAKGAYAEVWYSLLWFPICAGLWLSGWAHVYVCLLDPQAQIGRLGQRILQPVVLNTICLIFLLVLTFFNTYFAIRTGCDLRDLNHRFDFISDILLQHSHNWTQKPGVYQTDHHLLKSQFGPLVAAGARLTKTLKLACLWELLVAAFLFLFYFLGLFFLLRLMRRTLKISNPESLPENSAVVGLPASHVQTKTKWINKELYEGYRNLAIHCFLVATAQVLAMGIALAYRYGVIGRTAMPVWHTISPLLEMIPTSIITPVLLVRSAKSLHYRHTTTNPLVDILSHATL